MILVRDIYNKLATITGFPQFTEDTDATDTTRFLLSCLSDGLQNVIDNLYTANNTLERTDTIKTTDNKYLYGISGILKKVQYLEEKGGVRNIPYLNYYDRSKVEERKENGEYKYKGKPRGYVIENGYMRLIPIPDKAYTLKLTLSTTDLVMANNDISRNTIEDINDSLLASADFAELVVLNAAKLIFARCRNQNAEIYDALYRERRATYLEKDYGSMQETRTFRRSGGHYDSRRGLLD